MPTSTARSFQLGLIGYPVAHSLSPGLHEAALHACRLKGRYDLYPVAADAVADLAHIVQQVRAGEIDGLNVTIPHKQTVLRHLDQLSPTAAAIGAVNTIHMRAGKLVGDNTDAPAFLADLEATLLPDPSQMESRKSSLVNRKSSIVNRRSALVLGAGGAARAVVYALSQSGWAVSVAARRLEQAELLVADFPGSAAVDMSRRTFEACRDNLIVNTTPQGMSPDVEVSPWPANVTLPDDAVIYDLVYTPRETALVQRALTAGLSAVTGLGMLIEQAALAFEIWTGCSAPRAAMQLAAQEANSAPNH